MEFVILAINTDEAPHQKCPTITGVYERKLSPTQETLSGLVCVCLDSVFDSRTKSLTSTGRVIVFLDVPFVTSN